MFPAAFDYQRVSTLDEAIELLDSAGSHKLLAGGHSLIPLLKLRLANPAKLIDISRVSALRGIVSEGGTVRIGALTTHAELASSDVLAESCSLLPRVAKTIADPAVRNRGTIGGNLAHADPASDLPAALVVLDAKVLLRGPDGDRSVAAADFFLGLLSSDIRPREILVGVEIAATNAPTAYLKLEHPASGYALCGAAAAIEVDGSGRCQSCRVAFNGVADVPVLASAVGEALVGERIEDAVVAAAFEEHLAITDALSDLHASSEYRIQLAKTYGRRAILRAASRG